MNIVWYSICSIHQRRTLEGCPRCMIGNWVDEDDPAVVADRELWRRDPKAWLEVHRTDRLELEERYPSP